MKNEKIKPVSVRKVEPISGARFLNKIVFHSFKNKDGSDGRWESFESYSTRAVMLCGMTPEKKLILINLYRFPVDAFCFEFPGGFVEENESMEDAVLREFVEETGYRSQRTFKLSEGYTWNGKSNQKFEIWFGEDCVKVSEPNLDEVEKTVGLTLELASISDLKNRILNQDTSLDPFISVALLAMEVRGIV